MNNDTVNITEDDLVLTPFDADKALQDDDVALGMINEAIHSGDMHYIAYSLDAVCRAQGISNIAKKTHITRQALHNIINNKSTPSFITMVNLLGALGFHINVTKNNNLSHLS